MQTPKDFTNTLAGCTTPDAIEADFLAELAKLKAESLGWIPLEDGAYLHVCDLPRPRCLDFPKANAVLSYLPLLCCRVHQRAKRASLGLRHVQSRY